MRATGRAVLKQLIQVAVEPFTDLSSQILGAMLHVPGLEAANRGLRASAQEGQFVLREPCCLPADLKPLPTEWAHDPPPPPVGVGSSVAAMNVASRR